MQHFSSCKIERPSCQYLIKCFQTLTLRCGFMPVKVGSMFQIFARHLCLGNLLGLRAWVCSVVGAASITEVQLFHQNWTALETYLRSAGYFNFSEEASESPVSELGAIKKACIEAGRARPEAIFDLDSALLKRWVSGYENLRDSGINDSSLGERKVGRSAFLSGSANFAFYSKTEIASQKSSSPQGRQMPNSKLKFRISYCSNIEQCSWFAERAVQYVIKLFLCFKIQERFSMRRLSSLHHADVRANQKWVGDILVDIIVQHYQAFVSRERFYFRSFPPHWAGPRWLTSPTGIQISKDILCSALLYHPNPT